MLDIPSITGIVAAIGVVVGVTLAYLEVRTLVKQRQTDLLMGIQSVRISKEFCEAWEKVINRKPMGYTDYQEKHGFVEANQMASFYEGVGVLLHRKLVDVGLVEELFGADARRMWSLFKPIIEEARKRTNAPDTYAAFEYLYN